MSLGVRSRKLLWGRAGNCCAFPGCRVQLIEDETGVSGATVVGVEAHIVAQSPGGPRSGGPVPGGGDVDDYPNLILLCPTHHTIVDSRIAEYAVARLVEMKSEHEGRVRHALSPQQVSTLNDDVLYAEIVDEWTQRAMLDQWESWTSGILLCGQPSMRIEDVGKLRELARWLLKRVWPGSKPVLEAAFLTYRTVLVDLLNELEANSVTVGSAGAEALEVEKFYKQFPTYDPEQYAVLMQKFDRAVYTVEDLGIELTRAANLVADTVRETLSPRYRRAEGYVAICSGPAITGHGELTGSMTTVYQYPRSVDPATAYRGLAAVKAAAAERASRDA